MRAKKNSGFTLVEILIVVVILGILAAIVIPQFSNASKEANTSNCQSNLQTLRSQIALYKIKNNDANPDCTSETTLATALVPTYMQAIPVNPLSADAATGAKVVQGTGGTGDGTSGWYFDTSTGIMHANDSAASYSNF